MANRTHRCRYPRRAEKPWLPGLALFFVWVVGTAHADQRKYEIDKNPQTWSFVARWKDGNADAHVAKYTLPTSIIRQDLDTPLRFQKMEAAKYQARKINQYGKGIKGVDLKAKAQKGGRISWSASGRDRSKVKDALAGAKEVQDAALDEYLEDNGYVREGRRTISPDYAGHVVEYADDLAPVVDALGGPTDDPREFAEKALSFVQTIPYEHRAKRVNIYRRPLSLLGRNKGDCDSKTVLFLALLHQAYPDLPLAMVRIPGHAFGAVGFDPQRGDARFRRKGQRWVAVEPVGPGLRELGDLGRKSRWRVRFRLISVWMVEP